MGTYPPGVSAHCRSSGSRRAFPRVPRPGRGSRPEGPTRLRPGPLASQVVHRAGRGDLHRRRGGRTQAPSGPIPGDGRSPYPGSGLRHSRPHGHRHRNRHPREQRRTRNGRQAPQRSRHDLGKPGAAGCHRPNQCHVAVAHDGRPSGERMGGGLRHVSAIVGPERGARVDRRDPAADRLPPEANRHSQLSDSRSKVRSAPRLPRTLPFGTRCWASKSRCRASSNKPSKRLHPTHSCRP